MIHSMTAFARQETKGDWGVGVWEIRSVNQRYLEPHIRLPEQFRALEPVIRERLRKNLNRGKIEINLRYTAEQGNADNLKVNQPLAEQLIKNAQWIQQQAGQGNINPTDILRWPGVLETAEDDMDKIQSELLAGFDAGLKDFIAARASEGENLKAMIVQRLEGITAEVENVKTLYPTVIGAYRERLMTKLEDMKTEYDEGRFEQEMIYVAQKLDIAEELDRLNSHVAETHKILKKGGACGRRLDFMMQEFNRESNTLSSKSVSPDVTKSAVEMKVLIEQMREQIQNIEYEAIRYYCVPLSLIRCGTQWYFVSIIQALTTWC